MREIFEEYGGIVVISLVGMSIVSGLLYVSHLFVLFEEVSDICLNFLKNMAVSLLHVSLA